jgi:hypothetical protein
MSLSLSCLKKLRPHRMPAFETPQAEERYNSRLTGSANFFVSYNAALIQSERFILSKCNRVCEWPNITKQLICEKGFSVIAVEADWPDAYRVNRY